MSFYGGKSQQCQDWANAHTRCPGRDDMHSACPCSCSCHIAFADGREPLVTSGDTTDEE